MSNKKLRVGVVGCGNISGIYLQNSKTAKCFEVVGVTDADPARAQAKAAEHGGARAMTLEELVEGAGTDVVLNLTPPAAHASVAMRALRAGKHVYNEKPLAISLGDARDMMSLAKAKERLVGCAPDTFLGAALTTARGVIDSGQMGRVVAGSCVMLSGGPEAWHPDPEFFFAEGGGPLFDMGPYYLTALVYLLGPVARVAAIARATHATRTVGSGIKKGKVIDVQTPTHIAGLMEFASGAVVSLTTSFDVPASTLPPIQLHGTGGALHIPDPNYFGGEVKLQNAGEMEAVVAPLVSGATENARGLGLDDLCSAAREGRAPRASGELALHVLEVMHAMLGASASRRTVDIASAVERPSPLPRGG